MYRHEKRPLPGEDALDRSHAYRLKQWPQIPDRFRTARVLGACSRMTVGPVTSSWFLAHTGLVPAQAAELVADLVAQGALERLSFGPRGSGQAAVTRVPAAPVATLRERLAQRFAWKRAAAAAILCLGVSAALDDRFPLRLDTFATPNLPAATG